MIRFSSNGAEGYNESFLLYFPYIELIFCMLQLKNYRFIKLKNYSYQLKLQFLSIYLLQVRAFFIFNQ